ncbi:NblA/ycf18 family protein [Alkalinema pantanalense CENA528]|uniref:NblA/ycf18 family protein n=1 Tax=Alkalinema pantanalense TaxID=1620705 RepID=UPI003D7017C4
MDKSIELTLEQQFNLRSFATLVRDMSREQAQEFLVSLYEQMLIKDAYYKHFLRQEWGVEERGWEGTS